MLSISFEAQRMVREAAKPVRRGATVKEQMNAAARSLGYPAGHWRIRAAWNGEADSWSAVAFQELKDKYDGMVARQRRTINTGKQRLAALYAELALRLEETDAQFHRGEIDRLIDTARALGDVAG